MSLNVIRVTERICEIFQNFIQCSFVVFLSADMLAIFISSIFFVFCDPRLILEQYQIFVSDSAVVTCEKLEVINGVNF